MTVSNDAFRCVQHQAAVKCSVESVLADITSIPSVIFLDDLIASCKALKCSKVVIIHQAELNLHPKI